jgi:hypothetical protein
MTPTPPETTIQPWEPESPFQDGAGYARPAARPPQPASPVSRETPFVDEYFAGDRVVNVAPERAEFLELLGELYTEQTFSHSDIDNPMRMERP